ncbi:hypothetical protein Acsp05_55980 [Actinokineospora sp. NBRC 105648]|nr:hypothetical protein Acsp05_55980 [Actinokineospora sp. NBRC 105648]
MALLVVACVYAMVWCYIVFGAERDGNQRSVDAYATNVTCSRNWLVLGAAWSCQADVVIGGRSHPYSSFASALTPADVGTPVPMNRLESDGRPTDSFTPARARPELGPLVPVLWLVLGGAALFGAVKLWPRKTSV